MPHIHFVLGFMVLETALMGSPSYGGSRGESSELRNAREERELRDVQAEQARAYNQYYKALRNHSGEPSALATQILAPSSRKMTGLLAERAKSDENLVRGRTFLQDGTSVETSEFKRNPEKYIAQVRAYQKSEQGVRAQESVSQGSQRPGLYSDQESGPGVAPASLDGSNIPKELSFPSLPKKGTAGERSPASRR